MFPALIILPFIIFFIYHFALSQYTKQLHIIFIHLRIYFFICVFSAIPPLLQLPIHPLPFFLFSISFLSYPFLPSFLLSYPPYPSFLSFFLPPSSIPPLHPDLNFPLLPGAYFMDHVEWWMEEDRQHWEFHIIATASEWVIAAAFVVVLLSLVPGALVVVVVLKFVPLVCGGVKICSRVCVCVFSRLF